MKQIIDVKGTVRNLVVFVLIVFSVYAGLVIHNNKREFKEYQYQAYQADVAKNLESAQIEYLNLNFGTALAKARTAREVNLFTYYKCYVTYPLNRLPNDLSKLSSVVIYLLNN